MRTQLRVEIETRYGEKQSCADGDIAHSIRVRNVVFNDYNISLYVVEAYKMENFKELIQGIIGNGIRSLSNIKFL